MATGEARMELKSFVGSGRLRQAVEGKLSEAATDLLIDVVGRYFVVRKRTRLGVREP